MELRYDMDVGWPSQLEETMKRRVSALVKGSHAFKVGITSDPDRRKYGYGTMYKEMIVIYRTTSETNVRSMEKQLYSYYGNRCEFDGQDGAAARGPLGNTPYFYLYVVRD